MATIVVDPLTRIEGHVRVVCEVNSSGNVTDVKNGGTMFRGFENILETRDPRDAPQITQRICGVCPTGHTIASARAIDSALNITLNDNGRILRNIIHGADTIMSHILHFYHLSAMDFIDASALGSPWSSGTFGSPFGKLSSAALLPVTAQNILNDCIALNYVEALNIRRDAHTLGAIFSGRQPICNAVVPGGASTIVTQTDVAKAKTIINKIRNFINLKYIPDVVTAATVTSAPYNFAQYWNVGTNPNRLLSYGEYPLQGANAPFVSVTDTTKMLIQRGVVSGLNIASFDPSLITEEVIYSKYSSPTGLHPSEGKTKPDPNKIGAYSWLKAPRYNGQSHEVGPLARVLASYLTRTNGGSTPTVSETGSASASYLTLPTNYDIAHLVDAAVGAVNTYLGGWGSINHGNLYSPLGRHAARALEAKFIADAMGGACSTEINGSSWLDALTFDTSTSQGNTNAVAYGYTYVKIPKATVYGTGLCEAPRGALGHWIKILSKKIANYQCVVPTTWNNGPRGSSYSDLGVAESVLYGLKVCNGDPTSSTELQNEAALNIARMLHPYDFCTACAVHVVSPEGKELVKFTFDLDGKIRKIPVDSE